MQNKQMFDIMSARNLTQYFSYWTVYIETEKGGRKMVKETEESRKCKCECKEAVLKDLQKVSPHIDLGQVAKTFDSVAEGYTFKRK